MHSSIIRTFKLFLDSYYPNDVSLKVLEIGSQNINGGLRDFKRTNMSWFGVDLIEGPGVDKVINVGEKLPFPEETFDLVLASSVFEHDIQFWNTFVEMVRVTKNHGATLLLMPSQGAYHRYPLDAFRFYPDASLALEKWALFSGLKTNLLESFTTAPEDDFWADYVAIFSKMPFLHKDNLIGGKLMGENWIVDGQLIEETFQEYPIELRKILKLEKEVEELNLKLSSCEFPKFSRRIYIEKLLLKIFRQ